MIWPKDLSEFSDCIESTEKIKSSNGMTSFFSGARPACEGPNGANLLKYVEISVTRLLTEPVISVFGSFGCCCCVSRCKERARFFSRMALEYEMLVPFSSLENCQNGQRS